METLHPLVKKVYAAVEGGYDFAMGSDPTASWLFAQFEKYREVTDQNLIQLNSVTGASPEKVKDINRILYEFEDNPELSFGGLVFTKEDLSVTSSIYDWASWAFSKENYKELMV